jgi:hypothetical protein
VANSIESVLSLEGKLPADELRQVAASRGSVIADNTALSHFTNPRLERIIAATGNDVAGVFSNPRMLASSTRQVDLGLSR